MNETNIIREQIKHMRSKGVEPEVVYIQHELWVTLGSPCFIAGVCLCESDRILGKFEVR